MSNVTQQQVLTALKTHFNMGELEMLAFGLGIPFEDLGGSGRSGKALAMLQYTQRHGKYDDLIQAIVDERDEVNWDVPKSSSGSSSAKPQPEGNVTYIVQGDMVHGDKVDGDNIEIGSISDSEGIAVGKESSAEVTTEVVAPPQETKQPPPSEIHIHGNVTGSNIGGGTVTAENIAGGDITIGSKEEFKNQLTELQTLIKTIIDNGEIADKRDARDLVNDVNDALAEVKSEEPSAHRLERYLYSTSKILESAAQATTTAGKAGVAVLKAAPIAASLVKAVSLFL